MQLSNCRNKRYLYLVIIIAVGLTLYFVNPTAYWFWPKCPFKLLTGLSCPACGIQRFIHAMTNGHFREAIAYNYFLVYALPYISYACLKTQGANAKNIREQVCNMALHRHVLRMVCHQKHSKDIADKSLLLISPSY